MKLNKPTERTIKPGRGNLAGTISEKGKTMYKNYSLMQNVGRVKHLVNFHDGIKTHRDGSPFIDVRLFSNKKKRDAFINELKAAGYTEKR